MDLSFIRGSSVGAESSVSDVQIFRPPLLKIHQTHFLYFPTSNFAIPPHLPITKVMPPINRLPVEILGEIFMQFLQLGDFEWPREGHFISVSSKWIASPMILGQVCGYWRSVAISTPSLWCSIAVLDPVKSDIPTIRTWLERAAPHPLNIWFEDSFHTDRHRQKVTNSIISLFLEHHRSWRHIYFDVFGYAIKPLINIRGAPPMLESADIQLRESDGENHMNFDVDSLWRIIHSSPRLSQVNWHRTYANVRQFPTHIPWNRLKKLNLLHRFKTGELCAIVEQCTQIEELHIQSVEFPSTSPSSTPIRLLHLRYLTIHAKTSLHAVFNRLLTPALEMIAITYALPGEDYRGAWEFGDFLRRSFCSLKSFSFYDPHGEDVLGFLFHSQRQMDLLEALSVGTSLSPETIAALTLNSSSEFQLLPRLKMLTLPISCTSQDIVPMISSRLPGHVGRLEAVEALRLVQVGIKPGLPIPSELVAMNNERIHIKVYQLLQ